MIVADTDVLIDALAGRQPVTDAVARALRQGRLATTSVNAFELWSGSTSDAQHSKVSALLAATRILNLDAGAARRAASARLQLEASGRPIGMADYLIAGVCLSRGLPLLTRNRRHFERVEGLELVE